jgi:N-acetylmuramic acid 6-phosphate etherase
MDTERPSPRFSGIDTWDPQDALDAMIEAQLAAVAAVRAARGAIGDAVAAMEGRLGERGRLIYAGAGTSGRLAVQDGAELMPTFNWRPERLLLFIAGGREALLQAVEGAEDEMARAADLVERHDLGASDTMIAVAASGTTPFTLACLREAKRRGALTVGIANNRDTPILVEADCPMLMIRLGRVYKGLMVDVQASNAKLARRREAIVRRLTGRSREDVRSALARAGGNVKLAVLLLDGCELDLARDVLDRAGGRLAAAMESLPRRRAS